jgi:hypothetical protein
MRIMIELSFKSGHIWNDKESCCGIFAGMPIGLPIGMLIGVNEFIRE